MKSKWLKYIGVTLLALFLTIGVPILINESYKVGAGYITMWEAADVLEYYGTLLGAAIAIATLAITIIFTRKQIARDSFLKSEHEKWDRIEAVFADALQKINPMHSLNKLLKDGTTKPVEAIITIQQYRIACSIATDQLLRSDGQKRKDSHDGDCQAGTEGDYAGNENGIPQTTIRNGPE